MQTLSRLEAESFLDKFWDEMKREWFKLEVLQDYSAEDASPSLTAWKDGNQELSLGLMMRMDNSEWIKECQEKIHQGVKLMRVHVVEHPFTPYLEWELRHYQLVNQPLCGEKVYLVERPQLAGLNLPAGDLMMFDGQKAVVNKYKPNGWMSGATVNDQPDELARFLELKRQILSMAKPIKI